MMCGYTERRIERRMTRITSFVICALMLGLFVISQSFSSPNRATQNPALADLEEEIKRVAADSGSPSDRSECEDGRGKSADRTRA